MAFGTHWEWRGFGSLSPAAREALERLPLKFPDAQRVVDEYLWAPGAHVNIKLRLGDLKFKRRLESGGGLERWVEDLAENHPFPLGEATLEKLARDLSVRLPPGASGAATREELQALLRVAEPPVVLVSVSKRRWQREWGAGLLAVPVTVEVAELLSPEPVLSVGLEHVDREALRIALCALPLERLRPRSYLDLLPLWAGGGGVLEPGGAPY